MGLRVCRVVVDLVDDLRVMLGSVGGALAISGRIMLLLGVSIVVSGGNVARFLTYKMGLGVLRIVLNIVAGKHLTDGVVVVGGLRHVTIVKHTCVFRLMMTLIGWLEGAVVLPEVGIVIGGFGRCHEWIAIVRRGGCWLVAVTAGVRYVVV